ncbi:hypothetical protein [Streptomyces sp. AN091965]|uniref:hypothetical protein n=1 Tax=Streptomyces sp. AN091965 TaxID=2927803 RepID=UPI001F603476|nr:hypothetical protein [Streptomyces sp. AN091965]MCI3928872.1 hypothetical protein [Streptomyces sp. AN091965]
MSVVTVCQVMTPDPAAVVETATVTLQGSSSERTALRGPIGHGAARPAHGGLELPRAELEAG